MLAVDNGIRKKMKPIDKIRYTNRWFCYIDLLGFTSLVQDNSFDRVLPLYQEALDHLESSQQDKNKLGIYISWFSDTFIIFSRGGKAEDFANMESVCRLFFQYLILNEIPVRGSLTYGKFYSQQERNVFLGEALIDAYNYGEKQNWIGFLLTPAAIEQLESVSLSVKDLAFYREAKESNVLKSGVVGPVYAFAFNNGLISGSNPYENALRNMRNKSELVHHAKYNLTLEFIKKSKRR